MPRPDGLAHAYTIDIAIPQFIPQKIAVDISGRIFIVGNNRRLVVIEEREHIEEIVLESLYPCDIVDIDTDGFDIFLLDRLNKRIWTIKQETILEKGFPLEETPLHLAISERNYMVLAFRDRNELSIFSRNQKLFTGIRLDAPVRENEITDLVFSENILYIAEGHHGRIDVLPLFSPSQKSTIEAPSPSSLAIDRRGHLFVAAGGSISYREGDGLKTLGALENGEVSIAISDDSLFALEPAARKIDVYSIMYPAAGTNGH